MTIKNIKKFFFGTIISLAFIATSYIQVLATVNVRNNFCLYPASYCTVYLTDKTLNCYASQGWCSDFYIAPFDHTSSITADQKTPELTSKIEFTIDRMYLFPEDKYKMEFVIEKDRAFPFVDVDQMNENDYIESSLVIYLPTYYFNAYNLEGFSLQMTNTDLYNSSGDIPLNLNNDYMTYYMLTYSGAGSGYPEYQGVMCNFYFKARNYQEIVNKFYVQGNCNRLTLTIDFSILPMSNTNTLTQFQIMFSNYQVSYVPTIMVNNTLFGTDAQVIVNNLKDLENNYQLFLNEKFYDELQFKFNSYESFYNHIKEKYPNFNDPNMTTYEKLKLYRDIANNFCADQAVFDINNFGGTNTFGIVDYIISHIFDTGLTLYITASLMIVLSCYLIARMAK